VRFGSFYANTSTEGNPMNGMPPVLNSSAPEGPIMATFVERARFGLMRFGWVLAVVAVLGIVIPRAQAGANADYPAAAQAQDAWFQQQQQQQQQQADAAARQQAQDDWFRQQQQQQADDAARAQAWADAQQQQADAAARQQAQDDWFRQQQQQ